jgi:hypothetical protein
MPGQPLHFPSERETIPASIVKSRFDLWRLEYDMHDTVMRSRDTISQSLDLIAKVDEALTRTASIFSGARPPAGFAKSGANRHAIQVDIRKGLVASVAALLYASPRDLACSANLFICVCMNSV